LEGKISEKEWISRIRKILPDGMKVIEVSNISYRKLPQPLFAEYVVEVPAEISNVASEATFGMEGVDRKIEEGRIVFRCRSAGGKWPRPADMLNLSNLPIQPYMSKMTIQRVDWSDEPESNQTKSEERDHGWQGKC
jgi:hypothetical protein